MMSDEKRQKIVGNAVPEWMVTVWGKRPLVDIQGNTNQTLW